MFSGNLVYGHAIEIIMGLSSFSNMLSDFRGAAGWTQLDRDDQVKIIAWIS